MAFSLSIFGGFSSAHGWGEAVRPQVGMQATTSTFVDVVSELGQSARGLYITYPYMQIFKPKGVLRQLARSKMNAAVVDLKDDQGRISYRTEVEPFEPKVKVLPAIALGKSFDSFSPALSWAMK